MKYSVRVGNEELVIEVKPGDRLSIERDGERLERSAVLNAATTGADTLILDGVRHAVAAVRRNREDYDIVLRGQAPIRVKVQDQQSRAVAATSTQQGALAIKSPMPGIILDVRVKEGSIVARDQVLLILEAMKTENEIRSERVGLVKKVHVRAGQTIQSEALLIELEEPKAGG